MKDRSHRNWIICGLMTCMQSQLVSWHFEPRQPQRVTSRLKTMFILTPVYFASKSLNHKLSNFCESDLSPFILHRSFQILDLNTTRKTSIKMCKSIMYMEIHKLYQTLTLLHLWGIRKTFCLFVCFWHSCTKQRCKNCHLSSLCHF